MYNCLTLVISNINLKWKIKIYLNVVEGGYANKKTRNKILMTSCDHIDDLTCIT